MDVAIFYGVMPEIKVVIDEVGGIESGGAFTEPRHNSGPTCECHGAKVLARAGNGVVIEVQLAVANRTVVKFQSIAMQGVLRKDFGGAINDKGP